jgi:hypothetical protein
MKRLLTLLAALLVVAGVGATGPARAVINCTSNIVDGSATYDGTSTLSGTVQTGADALTPLPTCKSISYGGVISYTSNGTQVVQSTDDKGDGTNSFVRFSFSPVTSDNGTFCVALFSRKGNNIQDVAPTTANLSNPPTPVSDSTSPNGFSCGSGWVAINASGSSGGGGSGFAG